MKHLRSTLKTLQDEFVTKMAKAILEAPGEEVLDLYKTFPKKTSRKVLIGKNQGNSTFLYSSKGEVLKVGTPQSLSRWARTQGILSSDETPGVYKSECAQKNVSFVKSGPNYWACINGVKGPRAFSESEAFISACSAGLMK